MEGMRVSFMAHVIHPSGECEELGQCIEEILERLRVLELLPGHNLGPQAPAAPVERTWTEAQIRDAVCRWWRRFPDDPRVDGFIQRLREETL